MAQYCTSLANRETFLAMALSGFLIDVVYLNGLNYFVFRY